VPAEVEEVRFRSSGPELVGYLARPRAARQVRPGLVLSHGLPSVAGGAAVADATLPALADRLASLHGWVALAFAFRGCSGSAGDFSLGGWLEDLGAAVELMAAQPEVSGVWLAGFGTGGALALCAAAADPRIRGVAALAAPADFDDWASHPRRLVEFAREVGAIHASGFPQDVEAWTDELREIRPARCAESFEDRPLMVVHGAEDTSVPVIDARVLADAHGAADLRIISGASHDLRLDPRAIAVLIGWLERQWSRSQASEAPSRAIALPAAPSGSAPSPASTPSRAPAPAPPAPVRADPRA
jgi:putative redox protein